MAPVSSQAETQLRVVDPETRSPLPAGSVGLVLAKGPGVMQGYHGDAAATAKVIDRDGWFDTGDLGWLVPADGSSISGNLVLVGRAKDTIVLSSGENVEPGPLEEAILESPVIRQVMLVGSGERSLGALVVPDADALAERAAKHNKGAAYTAEEARAAQPAESLPSHRAAAATLVSLTTDTTSPSLPPLPLRSPACRCTRWSARSSTTSSTAARRSARRTESTTGRRADVLCLSTDSSADCRSSGSLPASLAAIHAEVWGVWGSRRGVVVDAICLLDVRPPVRRSWRVRGGLTTGASPARSRHETSWLPACAPERSLVLSAASWPPPLTFLPRLRSPFWWCLLAHHATAAPQCD